MKTSNFKNFLSIFLIFFGLSAVAQQSSDTIGCVVRFGNQTINPLKVKGEINLDNGNQRLYLYYTPSYAIIELKENGAVIESSRSEADGLIKSIQLVSVPKNVDIRCRSNW